VGLATVYRALQAFVASGEVDVVLNEEGEAIYRRCDSDGHHHHLVCRSCGLSVELPSEEVETWATKLARRHRFTSVVHVAELFGLCRACSR
jgi:Fur family ferric uptake transcriptional regulator